LTIWAELYVAVRHIGPPSLGTGFPRLIEKISQRWKGRAVEDALPGEEGGAVKLECQDVTLAIYVYITVSSQEG
jgi:hypothetical protein